MSDEDRTRFPEPRQPIDVTCTRCRRKEALPLPAKPDPAVEAILGAWHQTKTGWVCSHCWTGLDHRRERELCRLCGRDARADEDKYEDWRPPDESDDLLCPECEIAGKESVTVQLVKEAVRRWQRAGDFPAGYRALIENALAREREIVISLLRRQLELEGTTPTDEEWKEMVARGVESATAAWPEPVGQQKDDEQAS